MSFNRELQRRTRSKEHWRNHAVWRGSVTVQCVACADKIAVEVCEQSWRGLIILRLVVTQAVLNIAFLDGQTGSDSSIRNQSLSTKCNVCKSPSDSKSYLRLFWH